MTSILFYTLFLKSEYPGLFRIMLTHLISIPFLSSIPIASLNSKTTLSDYLEEKLTFVESLQLSANGIPPVLVSQFIVNTSFLGFHLPKFSFIDLLITAGSKLLTRPILQLLYEIFGGKPQSINKFDRQLLQQSNSNIGNILTMLTTKGGESNILLDLANDL